MLPDAARRAAAQPRNAIDAPTTRGKAALPYAQRIGLIALGYFLGAWLGLSLPYYGSYITLLWLPTGIAVAALRRWGPGVWPGIALGAFAGNLINGGHVLLAVCISVGNTLAPLIADAWLARWDLHLAFDRRIDVVNLAGGALLGMFVSALGGAASLLLFGVITPDLFAPVFLTWWAGDTIGVLLGAPLLLTLSRRNLARLWAARREGLLWALIALPAAGFAFLQPPGHLGASLPLAFLTLPLLAWASLRFGVTGSALAGLFFAICAGAGAALGRGCLFLPDASISLVVLWGYIAIVTLTSLLVTALLAERQAMDDSRRDAEARLRAMYELTPLGLALIDMRGRLVEFNESFRAMFGYSNDELKAKEYWDIAAPGPRDTDLQHFETLKRTGQYGPYERDFRDRDGRIFPLQISGVLFVDKDGRRYSWSVAENIAERRGIQADLRIAATAFEAQVSMFVTDADGVILRVNKAFTEVTGFPAAEAIGNTPRIFRSGRHDPGYYKAMWESIARDGKWQGEIWDRRKTGEVYPLWLTISAVHADDGRVTNYVATQFDITRRKAAEEEIRNLAFYDPLTRLPNRRLFLDRLQHALSTSARSRRCGALLFIDLDHFKTLNDTMGHSQGDVLLQQVAQRLSALVREGDTVARFGGDEFVIMLQELAASLEEAANLAEVIGEKILAGLRTPYLLGGSDYSSTASIGITLLGPGVDGIEDLLKQADLAMYQAKAAGRNRLRFFDPKMQETVSAHLTLESNLRNAVRERQFVLHYQSQVDAGDRPTGAEVLVRWQHPERGLIYPDEFIGLAEETGLIQPLGQWVLDSACEQLARWGRQPGFTHLFLAVNVSGHQVRQPDFVERVCAALERAGADPRKLRLELTESLLVGNIEDTIEKMSSLSARGVAFALDDFGTGYSSLSYLKRLPLRCLKIDRDFVKDILHDRNDAAIARTVITLARSLGMAVVAEGVETAEQQEFLANNGCREFQGYLFSRPVPLQEFESYVLETV